MQLFSFVTFFELDYAGNWLKATILSHYHAVSHLWKKSGCVDHLLGVPALPSDLN